MTPEEFRELLHQQPFRPLRVYMTDGKTFDVRHPEMVMVLRNRIIVGIFSDASGNIPDRAEHCSLLHVVRVEELPLPMQTGTNGPAANA